MSLSMNPFHWLKQGRQLLRPWVAHLVAKIFHKLCGSLRNLFVYWLNTLASSTGRCNTGLQFTRRGFKAQGLSRALIQAQSYLVEIGLRVAGQVGFLREVLSQ
jgi:hypothetical protein